MPLWAHFATLVHFLSFTSTSLCEFSVLSGTGFLECTSAGLVPGWSLLYSVFSNSSLSLFSSSSTPNAAFWFPAPSRFQCCALNSSNLVYHTSVLTSFSRRYLSFPLRMTCSMVLLMGLLLRLLLLMSLCVLHTILL